MSVWFLIPGIVLFAASYVLQFGSFLRRPRSFAMVGTAIRLRFIGFGVLFLGAGLGLVVSSLRTDFGLGSMLVGIFLMAMAGTWFYAASDKIFRVFGALGDYPPTGSDDGKAPDRQ